MRFIAFTCKVCDTTSSQEGFMHNDAICVGCFHDARQAGATGYCATCKVPTYYDLEEYETARITVPSRCPVCIQEDIEAGRAKPLHVGAVQDHRVRQFDGLGQSDNSRTSDSSERRDTARLRFVNFALAQLQAKEEIDAHGRELIPAQRTGHACPECFGDLGDAWFEPEHYTGCTSI